MARASLILFTVLACATCASGRLAAKGSGSISVHSFVEAVESEVSRVLASPEGPAPAPGIAGPPAAASPASAAAQGLCGCSAVPANSCTCGASLSYLKCVSKRCSSGECDCPAASFEEQCISLAGACASELEIAGCSGQTTTCEGKFHQLNDGVAGLTLNTSHLSDEAYCGPQGKCTGELHVFTAVHRPAPGAWFECILPAFGPNRLVHCDGELSSEGFAECVLPMAHELDAGADVKGQCYLTDGQGGRKITRDAWFLVENRYLAAAAGKRSGGKAAKERGLVKTVDAEPADDAAPTAEMKSRGGRPGLGMFFFMAAAVLALVGASA